MFEAVLDSYESQQQLLPLVDFVEPEGGKLQNSGNVVWKPREQWDLGIDNIEHFTPTGEPDADYDTYKHHL